MQVSSPLAPVHAQNGILMSLWRTALIAFAIPMCVYERDDVRECAVHEFALHTGARACIATRIAHNK